MNKKLRKAKKEVKRKLNSIEFKRSCKNLKKQFLQEFKTAIIDSSYFEDENPSNFHPGWGGYKHPTITTVSDCWGETSQLATLNINRLSRQIANYILKRDPSDPEGYIVECYHPKTGCSWVNF